MLKKLLLPSLACLLLALPLFADSISDQAYINRLEYKNNKLSLVTKKQLVDVKSTYSYTDVDTQTYSVEAYGFGNTGITTQSRTKSVEKEITEWYIYKGGVRTLSDAQFLKLIGDQEMYDQVMKEEDKKAGMRNIGNVFIGTGLLVMIGGAVAEAGAAITTGGAVGMTIGFFLNAFNSTPHHYIQPDFAQEQIDLYNVKLKKKLDLPLDYD